MHVLDIMYNHLLYNTYGPICITLKNSMITKIQTNNGTGKTIFLKAILGLIKPTKGILLKPNNVTNFNIINNIKGSHRLSSSQFKKFKIILAHMNKYTYWVLDEPYSYLDLTSVHYFKKKILECNFKRYTIVITDCIHKSMLPTLIFYFGTRWV